jgi:photosystem II stability/assembly factor-like uncharacterized protein
MFPQWTSQPVPAGIQFLSSISFVNFKGVAGAQRDSVITGDIIYTSNGGTNWLVSTVPANTGMVNTVQLINEQIGYASGRIAGIGGMFLKTTDGGVNWFNYGALPFWITAINGQLFLNETIGYITVDSAQYACLLKTTDGGLTWNKKLWLNIPPIFNKIIFGNSSTGFIFANYGPNNHIIYRTTDSGETWGINYSLASSPIWDMTFSDGETYYFTSNYSAYKTTNAGNTWTQMTINGQNLMFGYINFFSGGNKGFMFANNNISAYYFISNDRGNTWTQPILSFSEVPSNAGCMVSEDKWYLITNNLSGAKIFMTLNGGTPVELTSFLADIAPGKVILHWSTATETNNRGFEIERFSGEPDSWRTIGYVSGNGTSTEKHSYTFTDKITEPGKFFYRLKQVDFDGKFEYSKEIESDASIPSKFGLSQNYPNPFNPSTIISYQLSSDSKVKLTLYDITGREAVVLVNQVKAAGTYNVLLEADKFGLSSGTYFYTIDINPLNGDKNFRSTKKMIYLK